MQVEDIKHNNLIDVYIAKLLELSILLKLFKKKKNLKRREYSPMYCTLIPKPHKNTTGKHHKQQQQEKHDKPISQLYIDAKIVNKLLTYLIQQYI